MSKTQVVIQFIGDPSSLVKAGSIAEQVAEGVNKAWAQVDNTAKAAGQSINQAASGAAAGGSKAKGAANNWGKLTTQLQIARREGALLANAWKSGSSVIDRRYLGSITGLRDGLKRLNKEAETTIVLQKGVLTTLNDPRLNGAMFMIKGNLITRTLDNMGKKLINVGKNAQWTGRQMMVGITAPLAAIALQSGKTYLEIAKLDLQIKKLVQGEANTPVALKALDEQSRKISTTLATTRSDVKEMQLEFASVGFDSKTIHDLTQITSEFQKLGNLDASDAIEFVRVLKQQGYSIEQVRDTLERLNLMENKTALNMKDVVGSFSEIFPLFRQLNSSAPETIAILTAFKQGGIDVSTGVSTLKTTLTKLAAALSLTALGGKAGASRLKFVQDALASINSHFGTAFSAIDKNTGRMYSAVDLLLQLGNAWRTLEQSQSAVGDELQQVLLRAIGVGEQSANLAQLLDSLAKSMDGTTASGQDLAKAMGIAKDASTAAADAWSRQLAQFMGDPSTKFQNEVNKMINAAQELGRQIVPIVTDLLKQVNKIIDRFDNLSDGTKKAILTIAAGFALLGPVVYIAGQGMIAFGTIFRGLVAPFKSFFNLQQHIRDTFSGSTDAIAHYMDSMSNLTDEFRGGKIDRDNFIKQARNIVNEMGTAATSTQAVTAATKAQAAASAQATTALNAQAAAQAKLSIAQKVTGEGRFTTAAASSPSLIPNATPSLIPQYGEDPELLKYALKKQLVEERLSNRIQFDKVIDRKNFIPEKSEKSFETISTQLERAKNQVDLLQDPDTFARMARELTDVDLGSFDTTKTAQELQAEVTKLKGLKSRLQAFEKRFGRAAPVVDPDQFDMFEEILKRQISENPDGPRAVLSLIKNSKNGDPSGLHQLFADAMYEMQARQAAAFLTPFTAPGAPEKLLHQMLDDPKIMNPGGESMKEYFEKELNAGRTPRMPVRSDSTAKLKRKAKDGRSTKQVQGLKLALQDVIDAREALAKREAGTMAVPLPLTSEAVEEIYTAVISGADIQGFSRREKDLLDEITNGVRQIRNNESFKGEFKDDEGMAKITDHAKRVYENTKKQVQTKKGSRKGAHNKIAIEDDKLHDALRTHFFTKYDEQSQQTDAMLSAIEELFRSGDLTDTGIKEAERIRTSLRNHRSALENNLREVSEAFRAGLTPAKQSVEGVLKHSKALEDLKKDVAGMGVRGKMLSPVDISKTQIGKQVIDIAELPFEGRLTDITESAFVSHAQDTYAKAFEKHSKPYIEKRRKQVMKAGLKGDEVSAHKELASRLISEKSAAVGAPLSRDEKTEINRIAREMIKARRAVDLTPKDIEAIREKANLEVARALRQLERTGASGTFGGSQRPARRVLEGSDLSAVGIGAAPDMGNRAIMQDRRSAFNAMKGSVGLDDVRKQADSYLEQLGFGKAFGPIKGDMTDATFGRVYSDALRDFIAKSQHIVSPEGVGMSSVLRATTGHSLMGEFIKQHGVPEEFKEAVLDAIWGGADQGVVKFKQEEIVKKYIDEHGRARAVKFKRDVLDKDGKRIVEKATGYAGKLYNSLGDDFNEEQLAVLNEIIASVMDDIPGARIEDIARFRNRSRGQATTAAITSTDPSRLGMTSGGSRLKRSSDPGIDAMKRKQIKDDANKAFDEAKKTIDDETSMIKGFKDRAKQLRASRDADIARVATAGQLEEKRDTLARFVDDFIAGSENPKETEQALADMSRFFKRKYDLAAKQDVELKKIRKLSEDALESENFIRDFENIIGGSTSEVEQRHALSTILGTRTFYKRDSQGKETKEIEKIIEGLSPEELKGKSLPELFELAEKRQVHHMRRLSGLKGRITRSRNKEASIDEELRYVTNHLDNLVGIVDPEGVIHDLQEEVTHIERSMTTVASSYDRELSKLDDEIAKSTSRIEEATARAGSSALLSSNLDDLVAKGRGADVTDLDVLGQALTQARSPHTGQFVAGKKNVGVLAGNLSGPMAQALHEVTALQLENLDEVEAVIKRHVPEMAAEIRKEAAVRSRSISRYLRQNLPEAEALLGNGITNEMQRLSEIRGRAGVTTPKKTRRGTASDPELYDPMILGAENLDDISASNRYGGDTDAIDAINEDARSSRGGTKSGARIQGVVDDEVDLWQSAYIDSAEMRVERSSRAISEVERRLAELDEEELKARRRFSSKRMHAIKSKRAKLASELDTAKKEEQAALASLNSLYKSEVVVTDTVTGDTTRFPTYEEYIQSRRKEIESLVSDDELDKLTKEEHDSLIRKITDDAEKRAATENEAREKMRALAARRAGKNVRSHNTKSRLVSLLTGTKYRPMGEMDAGIIKQMNEVDMMAGRAPRKFNRRNVQQFLEYQDRQEIGTVIGGLFGGSTEPDYSTDFIPERKSMRDRARDDLNRRASRRSARKQERADTGIGRATQFFRTVKKAGGEANDALSITGRGKKAGGTLLSAASWLNPLKGVSLFSKGVGKATGGLKGLFTEAGKGRSLLVGMWGDALGGGASTVLATVTPLIPVLLVIGAIVAVLALNFKKWIGTARSGIDKMKEAGKGLINAFIMPLKGLFVRLSGDGKKAGDGIGNVWKNVGKIIGKIAEIAAGIMNFLKPIVSFIMEYIVSIIYNVVQVFRAVIAVLTGDWSDFGDALGEIWNTAWNMIKKTLGYAGQGIVEGFAFILKGIVNLVEKLIPSSVGFGPLKFKIPGLSQLDNALKGINHGIDEATDKTADFFNSWTHSGKDFGDAGKAYKSGKKDKKKYNDGANDAPPTVVDPPMADPEAINDQANKDVDNFINAFQNRLRELVDGWKEAAMKAYDDWAKAQVDAVDQKIKAIDDEIEAERKRDEDLDYLRRKEELREKRRSALYKYTADHDLAIYEGRYDDAKQLDYEHAQEMADIDKEERDVDEDRNKVLVQRERDHQKEMLELQKDALQKELDAKKDNLQAQLDAMTEYIPKNVAEAQNMQSQILAKMKEFTGGYGTIGTAQAATWGANWKSAFTKAKADMVNDAYWAGTDVRNEFAKALGIDLNSLPATTPPPPPPSTAPTASVGFADNIVNNQNKGSVYEDTYHNGPVTRRHSGGPIGNTSMSPSDVPATLQTGEYVIRRAAVAKYGMGLMNKINQGQATFHTGGLVGEMQGMAKQMMTNQFAPAVEAFKAGQGSIGGITPQMVKDNLAATYLAPMMDFDLLSGFSGDIGKVGAGLVQGMKQIVQFVLSKIPEAIITSTTGGKHANKSLHYSGRAVDFDMIPNSLNALIFRALEPLAKAGILEELYFDPLGQYNDGFYKEKGIGGHEDHVHAGIAAAYAGGFRDSIVSAIAPVTDGANGVKDIVHQLMLKFGWADSQWPSLDNLVTRESGWRPEAANPTSTARGLFQFLKSTWAAYITNKGGPPYWNTDVGWQARGGLDYIRTRYGSPAGAWDFWQRNHWYHKGGPVGMDPHQAEMGPSDDTLITVPGGGQVTYGFLRWFKNQPKNVQDYLKSLAQKFKNGHDPHFAVMTGMPSKNKKKNPRVPRNFIGPQMPPAFKLVASDYDVVGKHKFFHDGGLVFPHLDVGGSILKDGAAVVHRGETVVTEKLSRAIEEGGVGGIKFDIHIDGPFFGSDKEIEKLADTLEKRIVPKIQKIRGHENRTFRSN